MKDSLVRLDAAEGEMGTTPPGGIECELVESAVEDGGCTLSSSVSCTDQAGFIMEGQESTTQETQDGSRISGTLELSIRDALTRIPVCTSRYAVTLIRQ